DGMAVAPNQVGKFRRPVPGAQLVERNLVPVVGILESREGREIEGNDVEARGGVREQVGSAPFPAARDDRAAGELEFIREVQCLVDLENALGLEEQRLAGSQGLKRLERRVVGG